MPVKTAPPIAQFTETDLRLLRIFRAVAEAGGLTAAEPALRMERSTISRHLQALEARLGSRLCLRGPAGFELTDLGRNALQAAIMVCDTLDQVRDELNRARSVPTGDLMLGLADHCLTNPDAQVVTAIRQFRLAAPAVQLHISIKPPIGLIDDLITRHLHLAIAGSPIGYPKLRTTPLFIEEFRLYAGDPVDARAGPDALVRDGFRVVTRDRDQHSLELAHRLGAEQCLVVSGLEAVATLLASGRCIGFLPTHLVAALPHARTLHEVAEGETLVYKSDFSLVQDATRPLSAAGRLMLQMLVDAHGPQRGSVRASHTSVSDGVAGSLRERVGKSKDGDAERTLRPNT